MNAITPFADDVAVGSLMDEVRIGGFSHTTEKSVLVFQIDGKLVWLTAVMRRALPQPDPTRVDHDES